jgi:hypothetical protein
MKSILFFDDWMLDWRWNIARRFGRPVLVNEPLVFDSPHPLARPAKGYTNVIRNPESGLWQMWYEVAGSRPLPGGNFTGTLCYADSEDGFHWTYPDLGFSEQMGVGEELINSVGFDVPPIGTAKVAWDPEETDPARRYKLPAQLDQPGLPPFGMYVSPDGKTWNYLHNSSWFPDEPTRMGSDTDNNLLRNPMTDRYQIICRAACMDRRVAITESEDLVRWTPPRVILFPDALDEPLLQLYSMAQFRYHDHFIGLMQVQHVAGTEMGAVKWGGKVDNELVYSYNGTAWNRTDREPFIGRQEPGETGGEEMYANSMVEEPDGSLRFYSFGDSHEHGSPSLGGAPEGLEHELGYVVHRLRADGFAYVEPPGGYGYLGTRQILPRNGDLRLNVQAPNGRVWVQVSRTLSHDNGASQSQPIAGLRFEDCVPLSGDHTATAVQWKDGRGLDEFVDQGIRLEFKLFQARLYALHWDFRICYGDPVMERI